MSKIPSRIKTLKDLVDEYYHMAYMALVDNPHDLLRIANIKDSIQKEHPHEKLRIYISRKALKHIVEQRKYQLRKNHVETETLMKIHFAVEQIPNIIINFDEYRYEYQPKDKDRQKKHFYTKHYP